MRILDDNELNRVNVWQKDHDIEFQEAKAFIKSRAHVAELDINPKYRIASQRENYKRVFRMLMAGYSDDYKITMTKGKIIVVWLKYKKKEEDEKHE